MVWLIVAKQNTQRIVYILIVSLQAKLSTGLESKRVKISHTKMKHHTIFTSLCLIHMKPLPWRIFVWSHLLTFVPVPPWLSDNKRTAPKNIKAINTSAMNSHHKGLPLQHCKQLLIVNGDHCRGQEAAKTNAEQCPGTFNFTSSTTQQQNS